MKRLSALLLIACLLLPAPGLARSPVKEMDQADLARATVFIISKKFNCQGGAYQGIYYGREHRGFMDFCVTCKNGLNYRLLIKDQQLIVLPCKSYSCDDCP